MPWNANWSGQEENQATSNGFWVLLNSMEYTQNYYIKSLARPPPTTYSKSDNKQQISLRCVKRNSKLIKTMQTNSKVWVILNG